MPSLRATGLRKRYRGREVVAGVDLTVQPGEIVGLLGPNGAGKTTTFNMVVGLVQPDQGQVFIDSTDVSQLPMFRRARLGLGYLAQEATIFRKLTVRENFMAVLEIQVLNHVEQARQADAALAEFGLTHVAGSLGETLSGGERRRAEIARCLLCKPRFILFDEPFAGVDPLNVAELQKELLRLKEKGLGVLITDHNVRDTLGICDRAAIIAAGQLVATGTPTELAASSVAQKAYLGSGFRLA
jgi:lipopolysaccharide export system ATP-binding protein